MAYFKMICIQYTFVTVHEQNNLIKCTHMYPLAEIWSYIYHWISRIIGARACTLTNTPGILEYIGPNNARNTYISEV